MDGKSCVYKGTKMKKIILLFIFFVLLNLTFVHKELCSIYKDQLYKKRQALLSELLKTCNNVSPSTTCLYFISQEIAPELLKQDHRLLEEHVCYYY